MSELNTKKKSCCCCGCCYCVFSSIIQLTIFFLFRLVISCENRHRTCHYDCDNDLDLTLLLIMGVHSFNFQHNGHTRFLLLLNRHFIHTKNLDNISNWFKNILINIGFQRFTFAFQIIIIYVYRPSTHTLTLSHSHSQSAWPIKMISMTNLDSVFQSKCLQQQYPADNKKWNSRVKKNLLMQRLSNQICHKFEWFEWQCLGKRVFNFIKNHNNKANQSKDKQKKTKTKTRHNNNRKKQITHTNSQNMIMLLESILPCITRFSLIVYIQ